MTSHPRTRRYLWRTIIATAMFGLVVYLGSGLMGGERGLFAAARLDHEIADLDDQLAALQSHEAYLDKRVKALDLYHPDLDMLGEQARRVLFFSEPDEVVLKGNPSP